MHPTLLAIGSLRFHAYPAMLALAFLSCTLLAIRDLQRREPPVPATPQAGLWVFLGALVGAKVYWILQYSEPKYLWHALFVWEGGLVFYGGLIGGAAALFLYISINRLPVLPMIDTAVPYLALGEAITRVGCFLNGCCWGRETAAPWGVCFPKNSHAYAQQVHDHLLDASAAHSLPVHPTQLYMTFGLLASMALLLAVRRWEPRGGMTVAAYLFLYGVLRFSVEAFRADSAYSVFGLTVSQAFSVALAIVGLMVFVLLAFVPPRGKTERATPTASE